MTQLTSPDNIAKWTLQDPGSFVQASQTQGDSVQAALSKRERYDFVWANSSERTSQTGMAQGSRGYQVDTRSEYIFDSSNWRIGIPYAEFDSPSTTVGTVTFVAFGNISIDSTMSTSTTFATTSGSNIITLVDPGVYSISAYVVADAAVGGISFAMIGNNSDSTTNFASQIARGPFAGDNVAMMALPFYRTSSANQPLYFWYRQNSGANKTIYAKLRIGRLG